MKKLSSMTTRRQSCLCGTSNFMFVSCSDVFLPSLNCIFNEGEPLPLLWATLGFFFSQFPWISFASKLMKNVLFFLNPASPPLLDALLLPLSRYAVCLGWKGLALSALLWELLKAWVCRGWIFDVEVPNVSRRAHSNTSDSGGSPRLQSRTIVNTGGFILP